MDTSVFTITPMSNSIALDAGETYEGEIIVANPANSTKDFHYKVEISSYGVIGEDYLVDFLTETERSQISKWITIDNPTGVIAPNGTAKVHYKLVVPEDAPAGGQYAAFLVSSDNDETASDTVSIKNVFEMASILYAKINGTLVHDGELIDVSVPGFVVSPPIQVTSSYTNNGNVHEVARIALEVRSIFSADKIYPKEGDSGVIDEVIMPGTSRLVTRDINGISALGIYDVVQTVNYMGESQSVHQTVVVCPIWFMALLLVTVVAIITSIVFSVKRHRRKKNVI